EIEGAACRRGAAGGLVGGAEGAEVGTCAEGVPGAAHDHRLELRLRVEPARRLDQLAEQLAREGVELAAPVAQQLPHGARRADADGVQFGWLDHDRCAMKARAAPAAPARAS